MYDVCCICIYQYLLKYVILIILLTIKGFLNKLLFTCLRRLWRLLESDLLSVLWLQNLCNLEEKSIKRCKSPSALGCFIATEPGRQATPPGRAPGTGVRQVSVHPGR